MLRPAYLTLLGHTDYQRFTIVGHPRTGSNYLAAGLSTLNCIKVYHEIFAGYNREIGKDFDRILSRLFQKAPRSIRAIGFKVFYKHLTSEEWARLTLYEEFKIIHLIRVNKLRTLVSMEIAFKTGKWINKTKKDTIQDKSILLDADALIRKLAEIEAYEKLTRDRFKHRGMLEIVYEDLTSNPVKVFQEITEYLGMDEPIDASKIHLKKQNPENLEQLIRNYDEVLHLLRDSKFASCLDG